MAGSSPKKMTLKDVQFVSITVTITFKMAVFALCLYTALCRLHRCYVLLVIIYFTEINIHKHTIKEFKTILCLQLTLYILYAF